MHSGLRNSLPLSSPRGVYLMGEQDFLEEQLKTINNLTQIGILLRISKQNELLPTILELILQEAQQLVDDYCVIGEE